MEHLLPHLSALEALRGNPVLVYASMMTDDTVRVVYEWLRKRGRVERLDLVLSTTGGVVTRARQLALLLREYTEYLTILVPYRAWSSGTLLCLSADELILGPLAELGPIDTHIGAAGPMPPDAPGLISAHDVRAFRQMAEHWFGVERAEDRLQVLALVAQRIFPTSLSAFYRFDQLTRQIGYELLAYQLPNADETARQQIVDKLSDGYLAHDYIISRSDALGLGLNVRFASPQEETLMWQVYQACRAQLAEHPGQSEQSIAGLIAGTDFFARQVFERIAGAAPGQPGSVDVRWDIDGYGEVA